MKRRIFTILALSLVLVMVLGGCGTKLHTLTDSEQDMVVHYAAYVLAKYNLRQPDGMSASHTKDKPTTQTTEETQTQADTEEENSTENSAGSLGVVERPDTQTGEKLAIEAAIGYEGQVSIAYTGTTYATSYNEGNYYFVDAKAGKEFLILHFDVTNVTDQEIKMDVFRNGPMFAVSQDGEQWIGQDITYLLYDLSTFQGSIAPQETINCVVLFQTEQGTMGDVDDLHLQVTIDGVTYPIEGDYTSIKSNL